MLGRSRPSHGAAGGFEETFGRAVPRDEGTLLPIRQAVPRSIPVAGQVLPRSLCVPRRWDLPSVDAMDGVSRGLSPPQSYWRSSSQGQTSSRSAENACKKRTRLGRKNSITLFLAFADKDEAQINIPSAYHLCLVRYLSCAAHVLCAGHFQAERARESPFSHLPCLGLPAVQARTAHLQLQERPLYQTPLPETGSAGGEIVPAVPVSAGSSVQGLVTRLHRTDPGSCLQW